MYNKGSIGLWRAGVPDRIDMRRYTSKCITHWLAFNRSNKSRIHSSVQLFGLFDIRKLCRPWANYARWVCSLLPPHTGSHVGSTDICCCQAECVRAHNRENCAAWFMQPTKIDLISKHIGIRERMLGGQSVIALSSALSCVNYLSICFEPSMT